MTTEEALQNIAQQLSLQFFGKAFNGVVRINGRLRSSAGRYLRGKNLIEINPRYVEQYGETGLIDTLKHELIHYHYPTGGHGPVFRREAERIGCTRFCAPLAGNEPKLSYICQSCRKEYKRRRRINVRKYRCGLCRGKLLKK